MSVLANSEGQDLENTAEAQHLGHVTRLLPEVRKDKEPNLVILDLQNSRVDPKFKACFSFKMDFPTKESSQLIANDTRFDLTRLLFHENCPGFD